MGTPAKRTPIQRAGSSPPRCLRRPGGHQEANVDIRDDQLRMGEDNGNRDGGGVAEGGGTGSGSEEGLRRRWLRWMGRRMVAAHVHLLNGAAEAVEAAAVALEVARRAVLCVYLLDVAGQ